MSLGGAISDLANEPALTVTRTVAGTVADGIETPGASSTFSIEASVQPMSGRELETLPEGERGNEVRVLYTLTELKTRTLTTAPDVVTLGGEPWEVVAVESWKAFGETHYRCRISRTGPT